jgi:hypothetical protein
MAIFVRKDERRRLVASLQRPLRGTACDQILGCPMDAGDHIRRRKIRLELLP